MFTIQDMFSFEVLALTLTLGEVYMHNIETVEDQACKGYKFPKPFCESAGLTTSCIAACECHDGQERQTKIHCTNNNKLLGSVLVFFLVSTRLYCRGCLFSTYAHLASSHSKFALIRAYSTRSCRSRAHNKHARLTLNFCLLPSSTTRFPE